MNCKNKNRLVHRGPGGLTIYKLDNGRYMLAVNETPHAVGPAEWVKKVFNRRVNRMNMEGKQ